MKLEDLERKIASLQEGVTSSIKEREAEIARLMAEIARLEASAKAREDAEYRLTEDYCAELGSYGLLEFGASEKENLEAVLVATKLRIKSILGKIKTLEKNILLNEENISKQREIITSLEALLQDKSKQLEEMGIENDRLRALLKKEKKDKVDLEDKIQELSKEVEMMRNRIHELENTLADSEKRYLETREHVDKLSCDVDRIEAQRQEAVKSAEGVKTLRTFIELIYQPGFLEGGLRKPELARHKEDLLRLGCKISL